MSKVVSVVCVSFYVFRYLALGEIEKAVEYKGIVYPGFVLYTIMIGVSLFMLPGVYMYQELSEGRGTYDYLYKPGLAAYTAKVALKAEQQNYPFQNSTDSRRQLHVIKRAESALVHSITIDQKILFRRFQAKLRRSKIARARLWGDKDAERELRARDLHVMNTNCGQEQDDFEFLKKLEKRPCILDDETPKVKVRPSTADGGTTEVTDKDMEELIQAVMREQVPPPTDKTLQSLSTLGQLLEEARLIPTDSDTGGRRKSVQFPSGVGGGSRRASHQTTSMFEEQEKVDVVAMRLEEARFVDLTPKVDAFLKSLDECERRSRERMQQENPAAELVVGEDGQVELDSRPERDEPEKDELKGDRKFDYYATKMAIYTANVKRDTLPGIPGTPEEVNMRLFNHCL
nr:hypothetical protein BaRGS_019977 [Batillaria attramentaria]